MYSSIVPKHSIYS